MTTITREAGRWARRAHTSRSTSLRGLRAWCRATFGDENLQGFMAAYRRFCAAMARAARARLYNGGVAGVVAAERIRSAKQVSSGEYNFAEPIETN